MNEPLVTVVVSCYNHEKYIEACLQSVLDQQYPALELLVYDDGSADRSPELIRAMADHHGFTFVAQENKGYTKTLNSALDAANGKYFCAVGSDDVLLPDKTRKQVALMETDEGVAACGGNVIVIDENGKIPNRGQKFYPDRALDFADIFESRKPGIVTPSAMFRTDVLRAVGGYREDLLLEDFALWLALSHAGHRLYAMNDLAIYYRKHGANTTKNLPMFYSQIMKTLEDYREEPGYGEMALRHRISYFLRASKGVDKRLAVDILRHIPVRRYNWKVVRGFAHMLFTW